MRGWLRPLQRAFNSFLRSPLSVRKAMAVIVTATLVSVLAGGLLITVVDSEEFPDVGTGLWWALQTVTTVGYGDVTPKNVVGRLVGGFIMVESIAFVSIVTAAITSNFVERARRESEAAGRRTTDQATTSRTPSNAELAEQLAVVSAQLERLQLTLDRPGPTSGHGVVGSEPTASEGQ